MKKLFGLLLLLLVLGGIAYYLVQTREDKVSYDLSDSEFALKSKEDIYKIHLTYKNRPTVKLEKVNGLWMYNEKYVANELVVNNLITVFTRAKVDYIPPISMVNTIYNDIGIFGIKVDIFDKGDKNIKSFYIGGNNMDESATFFLMKGEKQPYAMHLSGMDGNLRDRFLLEDGEWRDRTIFGYKPKDVKSVTVVYPKQKTISFKITKGKDNFTVEPFYKTTKKIDRKVNVRTVENYLVDLEEKISEAIISDYEKRDSLDNLLPYCIIEVEKNDGDSRKVKLIPMKDKLQRGFGGVESKRFFALVDDGDLFLTQERVIKVFFRAYDHFFE